jgi:threonine dehydratase
MAAREATAAKVAADTGATFIPPYDYGPVIAGQGTIGLELLQQVRCASLDPSKCAGNTGSLLTQLAV